MAASSPEPSWLRQAVASALGQRRCTVELIVVDDGSPEPVVQSLNRLADPRLHVVRVDHGGVSRARNVGTNVSSGAYLRFLDADDVFPANSTARLLELAKQGDGAIACGATRWCAEDLSPRFDWRAATGRDTLRRYLLLRATPMLPSVLFPRRVVDAAGPWCEGLSVSEDWEFLLRALEHADVAETPRPVTYYRQHSGSASRDPAESWRGTLVGVERYFERHPALERTRLRRQVDAMLDLLAAELAQNPAPWRDRRFWRALARDPSCVQTMYSRFVHPRLQARKIRLRRRLAAI